MSLGKVAVLCLLIAGLLALVQAHRHHGNGGRRAGVRPANRQHIPRGPICKITDAAGSLQYEDADMCVLNSQCTEGEVPAHTCGDVQASFWFCSPKFRFMRGVCKVNDRDLGRNCTCGETTYIVTVSGQTEDRLSLRYCLDRPRRIRPAHRRFQDNDDDDELDQSRPTMFGTFYNDFDITTCTCPGREMGRRGGRRRVNGRG